MGEIEERCFSEIGPFFDACTRYWFIYLDDDLMYGDCMLPILYAHLSPFVY